MVHQQRARLNSFFPSHPAKIILQWCFTEWLHRALTHAHRGSVLGGYWTPRARCPHQMWLLLQHCPHSSGCPIWANQQQFLVASVSLQGTDPQLPSYPVAVVGLVSHPKIWAFNSNELWVGLQSWSLGLRINVQKHRGQPLRRTMVTFQQSIPTRKAIKYLIPWLLL